MKKSKLKCPKCQSDSLYVREFAVVALGFIQENGMIEEEGNLVYRDCYKVEANCSKCNHIWTVEDAIQITCIHL